MGHVIGVFFALGCTGIAHVGAKLHVLRHKLRITGFEPPAERTDVGAVAAKFDAGRHVVAFAVIIAHVKTGGDATFAGFGTFEAGIRVAVVIPGHFHNRCCMFSRPSLVC